MKATEVVREIYRKGKVIVNAQIGSDLVQVSVEKGVLAKTLRDRVGDFDYNVERREDGNLYLL